MKILHLETSSKNCSVAISENEKLLCLCEEKSENYKQSESLHTFVQWALEGADITLQDVEAVSLGMGPGSYTGLRIGASAAKGFCFGLHVPLVAVNSLHSIAEPFLHKDFDIVIPMVDARRAEVYSCIYDGKSGKIINPTEAVILDQHSFREWSEKNILFVGDGAEKASQIIKMSNAEFRSDVFPSSQYLIRTAYEKIKQQQYEDVAYFEPFYLKEFQGIKKNEPKK